MMRNSMTREGMAISANEALMQRRNGKKDLVGASMTTVNRTATRTVVALRLNPIFNLRGSYYNYDLQSEAVFTATKTDALAMPELVVQNIVSIWKREIPKRRRAMRVA